MEPSKHKIIRCSENKVEREVLHSSVNKYTPRLLMLMPCCVVNQPLLYSYSSENS